MLKIGDFSSPHNDIILNEISVHYNIDFFGPAMFLCLKRKES